MVVNVNFHTNATSRPDGMQASREGFRAKFAIVSSRLPLRFPWNGVCSLVRALVERVR